MIDQRRGPIALEPISVVQEAEKIDSRTYLFKVDSWESSNNTRDLLS